MPCLKDRFLADGCVILPGLLAEETPTLISKLNEVMSNVQEKDKGDWNSTGFVMSPSDRNVVQKIQSVGLYFPEVCDLVFRNDKVQKVLEEITDVGTQVRATMRRE